MSKEKTVKRKLKWKKDTPKLTGWYWCKCGGLTDIFLVIVHMGETTIWRADTRWESKNVRFNGALWCGPIPKPESE